MISCSHNNGLFLIRQIFGTPDFSSDKSLTMINSYMCGLILSEMKSRSRPTMARHIEGGGVTDWGGRDS